MHLRVKQGVAAVVVGLTLGVASLSAQKPIALKTPAPIERTWASAKDESEKKESGVGASAPMRGVGEAGASDTLRPIAGLSMQRANLETIATRLEGAQVILQGMDHRFELGYDKNAQLLSDLARRLSIGAVLLEEYTPTRQDSLSAFCTEGRMNQTVEWTTWMTSPHTKLAPYSMLLTLSLAREAGVDLLALGPTTSTGRYEFMRRAYPAARYIDSSNVDMLQAIEEALASHPGQRVWVQVGQGHVPDLQKKLQARGVASVSFEVWAPDLPTPTLREGTGKGKAARAQQKADWLTPLINKTSASARRYLPALNELGAEALIENPNQRLSAFSDFILYTPQKPLEDLDYMRLMPTYLEREIRQLEARVGRMWLVERGVLESDGSLPVGRFDPPRKP